jgi:hypothetical protein
MAIPTAAEIGHALAELGNYRVLRVQEVCYPYHPIPASVMLGIGFRETGLRNICGGATWDGTKWVQSYSDRGWLQISDVYEADFLKQAEGCKEGEWGPANPPVKAITERHVPRFTPALNYVKQSMLNSMEFAFGQGVPSGLLLRFAIAAHNAGDGGALRGYREGNVDKYTAHGDYSQYVLALQPAIHDWITTHPNWIYKRQTSSSD